MWLTLNSTELRLTFYSISNIGSQVLDEQVTRATATDNRTGAVFAAGSFGGAPVAPRVEVRQGSILPSTLKRGLQALSKVLEVVLHPPTPVVRDVVISIDLNVQQQPSSSSSRRLLQQEQRLLVSTLHD